MADYAALPLFTDAYMADCSHLSDAEHGRYLLLLMLMWRSPGCRVPNDRHWLARKLRRTPEAVDSEVMPLVREFCQSDGNWLTQKRLQREHEYVSKRAQSQSERAKSRWHKTKKNADAVPTPSTRHQSGNAPTPTPTPTPTEEPPADAGGVAREARPPPKPRAVKFTIPIDWQPSPETVATLKAKGYSDHEIAWQRDRFVAHFLDSGIKRPGWDRSFHNWVTRDRPGQHLGGYRNGRPESHRQGGGGIVAAVAAVQRAFARPDGDE